MPPAHSLRAIAVHPRVCGERARTLGLDALPCGSSPRVRGTLFLIRQRNGYFRFIPACAGNASMRQNSPPVNVGSSPRVRGTRPSKPPQIEPGRFIPACAGNAFTQTMATAPIAVHPRVCGERAGIPLFSISPSGSSPRVRGTLACSTEQVSLWRFIPACAGNAWTIVASHTAASVHPRVCGERVRSAPAALSIAGSSPRVRGTPFGGFAAVRFGRFIPACAGNALLPTS